MRTAYHEAGHALVALALGLPVAQATIVPNLADNALGSVSLVGPENTTDVPSLESMPPERLARLGPMALAWSMSGPIAERIAFGNVTHGCEGDHQSADAATEHTNDVAGTREWQWRPWVHAAVEHYLRRNWDAVSRLATTLLMEGTVTGERAREIVGTVPLLNLKNAEGGIAYWSRRMAARMSA